MTLDEKAAALAELMRPKMRELGLGFVLVLEDADGERAMLTNATGCDAVVCILREAIGDVLHGHPQTIRMGGSVN